MKKKLVLIIVILLLFLFLLLFMFLFNYNMNNIKTNKRTKVELTKCVDGDTVWLKIKNKEKKYRLLGIDSPEISDNYGKEATKYTCNLLNEAELIEIEYDKVGKTIDKYNRELVWIFIDNELLQSKILEQGLAKVKYIYASYEYLDLLYEKESYAIDKRIGIWNNYSSKTYNEYYTVTFNYTYKNKSIKVLKNTIVKTIDNPYKEGCRFIGWKNGNYLFDLSTKINKEYYLKANFDC